MIDRIETVVAFVSILISCMVSAGCRPFSAYITVDSRSALMQPTFCISENPYFQEPLDIEKIIVQKVPSTSDGEKGWDLDSEGIFLPMGYHPPQQIDPDMVWYLQYKSSDFILLKFINSLLGRRSKSPVSCLTYGEVPPDYEEKVKAVPLEPNELYFVLMKAHDSVSQPEDLLRFIIRLDDTGIPERLEYILQEHILDVTQYYLKLY